MRCPDCGCAQTSVRETRASTDDTVNRRVRVCFNGHRFTTFEVSERMSNVMSQAPGSARAVGRAEALYKRDRQIERALLAGNTVAQAAKLFGLAPTTVSYVIKKRMPDFDARSAGQKARRASESR